MQEVSVLSRSIKSCNARMFRLLLIPCFHVIAYGFLGASHKNETHWWLLHILCNIVVASLVWSDIMILYDAPEKGADITSRDASIFAVSVHVYHSVAFSLSWEDRFHHTMFAGIMGGLTASFPSHASNAALFFLSGLPGGLIYFLLVARRCGSLQIVNEPLFSAIVNMFVRLLGIVLCLICFVCGLFSESQSRRPPPWIGTLQFLLCLGNGVYYTHQSFVRVLKGRRSPASST